MTGRDRRRQFNLPPPVAARAVGVEPVAVLAQAGKRAEVDHGASVARACGGGESSWALSALIRHSCITQKICGSAARDTVLERQAAALARHL